MAIKKIKPKSPDPYVGKTVGDSEFARLAHLNYLIDQLNCSNCCNSLLFPNGIEFVTESRDFLPTDVGKLLIPISSGIQFTMPIGNSVSNNNIGKTLAIYNLSTGFSYTNGANSTVHLLEPIGEYPGEFLLLTIGDNQGQSVLTAISTALILDNGVVKTALKYLYDKVSTPAYKVYTALLTQSGEDDMSGIYSGVLTVGKTYTILDMTDGSFTNVGAPNNNIGTSFVATGTTPNWGTDSGTGVSFNNGAPVVTVLENTIGNIWFTWAGDGQYIINSDGLFTVNKTYCESGPIFDSPISEFKPSFIDINGNFGFNLPNTMSILAFASETSTGLLNNTPIEIRVYN